MMVLTVLLILVASMTTVTTSAQQRSVKDAMDESNSHDYNNNNRRRLFDRHTLPRLKDSDAIELYHLRSFPQLLIDSAAGKFLIQTSGLALRSTTTSDMIVLEYQPTNYSACFLPLIDPNDNKTLIWDKRAQVFYRDALDTTYWQQSTFLARINGVVYQNYIKWVQDYVSSDSVFVPQSICSSDDVLSCFTSADTSETFLSASLRQFAKLAVRMHAIIPPRASELLLLSFSEPLEFMVLGDEVWEPYANSDRRPGGPKHGTSPSSSATPAKGTTHSYPSSQQPSSDSSKRHKDKKKDNLPTAFPSPSALFWADLIPERSHRAMYSTTNETILPNEGTTGLAAIEEITVPIISDTNTADTSNNGADSGSLPVVDPRVGSQYDTWAPPTPVPTEAPVMDTRYGNTNDTVASILSNSNVSYSIEDAEDAANLVANSREDYDTAHSVQKITQAAMMEYYGELMACMQGKGGSYLFPLCLNDHFLKK
jgi:hypothetical protein